MGVVVGTVFFQQSTDPRIVVSVMFQSLFYMLIGAMVLVRTQFFDRPIFYKQQDAKFFPTWSYVLGRSISAVPIALIDAIGYGSFIYWLVGLAYNDGASIANYFIFMLLLFVTSLTSGLLFSVFSSSMRDITAAQASIAILALFAVLFSGYTVQPDVIPGYYIWIYWLNCFAWLLRALAINEFLSGKFNSPSSDPGYTQGELALIRLELLKGVDGILEAGKMTALMVSYPLMDAIIISFQSWTHAFYRAALVPERRPLWTSWLCARLPVPSRVMCA